MSRKQLQPELTAIIVYHKKGLSYMSSAFDHRQQLRDIINTSLFPLSSTATTSTLPVDAVGSRTALLNYPEFPDIIDSPTQIQCALKPCTLKRVLAGY